jgi:PAS domain S-box-containing protein
VATIVIIDDQRTNREYLVTLLGYGGHRMVQAADGAEGFAVAKAERADLVIADILMSVMDGPEFVRQLRADPTIAAVPIIFCAAQYYEREAQALAHACGVFHVLAKPWEPQKVIQTVEAVLRAGPVSDVPPLEEFEREHLRLLTNKLFQKAIELRSVNERLRPSIDLDLDLGSAGDPTGLLQSLYTDVLRYATELEREVEERKRAEEEVKRQKVILQTIFDHIPVMINFLDATGRGLLVNRHWERVLGWSLEEAQTRDLVPELYPDPKDQARVLEYILHPPPGWSDFKTRVRDGRILDTAWAVIALSDGTRIGFGQDITERKQAAQALKKYAAGLQALSRRLVEVQEEERRHLARELHDEFGQVLATITLHLHAARGLAAEAARTRLDECAKLLQQAGAQVRSLALDLRPTMLDSLGLEPTLRWLAEHYQQRNGCEVHVAGHLAEAPLSPEIAIACFRVAHEALTNVIRHASARHAWIELGQTESDLELVIRDNGVGFDLPSIQEQATWRGSLGLLGMRERVQILGGTLDVESQPGRGTRIRALFALSKIEEQAADSEE